MQLDLQHARGVEPTKPPTAQMGKMEERPVQIRITQVAALTIQAKPRIICPLDIGKTLAIFSIGLQTCRKADRHEESPMGIGASCVKGT